MDLDVDAIMAAVAERRPDPSDAPAVSAWMLGTLGVLHSPIYRSRELRGRLAAVGIEAPMAAYLVQRSAPLGWPDAGLIAATFYGFSPSAVAAHLPAAWECATPEQVLHLTLDAIREQLGRLLGDREAEVAELAGLLAPVAATHPTAGRPLAAAWAGVPPTGEPVVDLWLATATIRESRGDGHVALLVAEGIDPLASHLLTQGDRPDARPALEAMRGWTGVEIDAAAARLRADGLLDAEGRRTDRARELRRRIERRTDELSAEPWALAGPDLVTRIGDRTLALLPPVLASGTLRPPVVARLAPRG